MSWPGDGRAPITVAELIRHLRQFPSDMPVVYQCCSDWAPLEASDVKVEKGVRQPDWVMRAYESQIPTMSDENRANVREYLVFPGN